MSFCTHVMASLIISLVPRLLQNANMFTHQEPGIFSHNQNRTRVFRTERQRLSLCSTNYAFNAGVYDIRPQGHIVIFPLPLLFFLFWVFEYAHTQLRPLSTFNTFHVTKKYQALHTCTLQYKVVLYLVSSSDPTRTERVWWHPVDFLGFLKNS